MLLLIIASLLPIITKRLGITEVFGFHEKPALEARLFFAPAAQISFFYLIETGCLI